MGLSGKPATSSSQSYSGSGQQWATPYAQTGANSVQSVFNANQPGLQGLTDMTRNQVVNPLLGQFQSSMGPTGQANSYYGNVLSGKYMQGNPYLGQMINQTGRDVTNNVNSQFEMNGRYGSDAHGYGLARGLADSQNALQYQNYGDEMNRMGDAAHSAQTAGTSDAASLMAAIGAGAEMPYAGSTNLANSLGALFSGGTETSKSTGAKPGLLDYLSQMASNAASAAAAGSDRRLKTNITKVGEFPDGLGIYTFAYKADPKQMYRGVMADEVKELRPHAYVPNYQGEYAGVNYAAL